MIKTLVAIDPGVRNTGLAFFENLQLVKTMLLQASTFHEAANVATSLLIKGSDDVAVEIPRVYPKARNDPNDLINVAFLAGMYAAPGKTLKTYYPSEWKGNVPAEVCLKRVISRLSPDERLAIEGLDDFEKKLDSKLESRKPIYAKLHNVLDAVGIGLKTLGRL